jgi:hypothetical protein
MSGETVVRYNLYMQARKRIAMMSLLRLSRL